MYVKQLIIYIFIMYSFGTANRKVSDKNGFIVYLCQYHHEGTYGVHGKYGDKLNRELKQLCQKKYEELLN